MLMEFTFGNTECFLLHSCDANSTYSEPNCLRAGPVTPSMVDSCYGRFKFWAIRHTKKCAWMNLIVLWDSLFGDVCFFTNVCGTPLVNSLRFLSRQRMTFCWLWQAYSFCTSGLPWHEHICGSYQVRSFPSKKVLPNELSPSKRDGVINEVMEYSSTLNIKWSLLLVGDTPSEADSVRRTGASAVSLASTVFYCSGYWASFDPNCYRSCHSYLLGRETQRW